MSQLLILIFNYLVNTIHVHYFVIGYAILAAINTMPEPGQKVSLYEWLYDYLHALANHSQKISTVKNERVQDPKGAVK